MPNPDGLTTKTQSIQVFTKGGLHWTVYATVPYFNEMSALISGMAKQPVGTIRVENVQLVLGDPYYADGDLAGLLNHWGVLRVKPDSLKPFFLRYNFYSPHVELSAKPTPYRPDLFVVGGSFNWNWLYMVYGVVGRKDKSQETVFGITDFSYYNGFITRFPDNARIADKTEDFNLVMSKDIILVEFNEQACDPGAVQFVFAENLLKFLDSGDPEQ